MGVAKSLIPELQLAYHVKVRSVIVSRAFSVCKTSSYISESETNVNTFAKTHSFR